MSCVRFCKHFSKTLLKKLFKQVRKVDANNNFYPYQQGYYSCKNASFKELDAFAPDPSIEMREAPNQGRLEELLLQVLSDLRDLRGGELRARPQALPSDFFELSIYDVC